MRIDVARNGDMAGQLKSMDVGVHELRLTGRPLKRAENGEIGEERPERLGLECDESVQCQ